MELRLNGYNENVEKVFCMWADEIDEIWNYLMIGNDHETLSNNKRTIKFYQKFLLFMMKLIT